MKKLISTKMKVFMVFLLITSITCFTTSTVVLYRSNFNLSDYINFDRWNNWYNGNFGFTYNYNDYNTTFLDESLADIQNLNMDFTGHDVTLEIYSGSNLIINSSNTTIGTISRSIDPSNTTSNSLNVTTSEGTLTVLPYTMPKQLLIKVPSTYNKNINLKTTSGYIDFSNLTLESININGVNSDIYLNNINCKSSNIYTINGDINLDNLTSTDLLVDTVVGEIYASNLKSNIDFKTISGDIFAGLTNELTNANIKSTSGSINLKVLENNNFSIDYSTINGDLEQYSSDFRNYNITNNNRNYKISMGTGAVPISITTVDGDLSF